MTENFSLPQGEYESRCCSCGRPYMYAQTNGCRPDWCANAPSIITNKERAELKKDLENLLTEWAEYKKDFERLRFEVGELIDTVRRLKWEVY